MCVHRDFVSDSGYTPVHLAAQSSNVDMLRLLVHGRADVDVPDGKSGRTAPVSYTHLTLPTNYLV